MNSDSYQCSHCGEAQSPETEHHCIEEHLDAIKDAVEEVKEAITRQYGGFLFYVMVGIGWGLGVAKQSGDPFAGAWNGLAWPISLSILLARYYWR